MIHDPAKLAGTKLSKRELQVFTLAAQGCTVPEIGARLYLTANSVKSVAMRGRRRIGARNIAHAVAILLTRRLITLPDNDARIGTS